MGAHGPWVFAFVVPWVKALQMLVQVGRGLQEVESLLKNPLVLLTQWRFQVYL